MERSLGYRLLDNMRETMKLESTKTELISALYTRKIYEETKNGIEAIEENLKVQASFYGIDYEEYTNRIEELKSNYIKEINRLNEEREFQFVNLQLELREARANQKISLVNAKKIYDSKEEFIKSDQYKEYLDKKEKLTPQLNLTLEKKDYKEYCTMLKELIDPLEIYNEKKEIALKKYNDYNSIITSCENKIEECMNETYEEIKNIVERPDLVSKYALDSTSMAIIVETDKESKILIPSDLYTYDYLTYERIENIEQAITNAITDVNLETKPKVYFMENHLKYEDSSKVITEYLKNEAKEVEKLDGILIATGSEVVSAMQIAFDLYKVGLDLRVVSMPSMEIFLSKGKEYEKSILNDTVKICVIEASSSLIWNRFATNENYVLGIDDYPSGGLQVEVLQKMNYDYDSLKMKIESLMR